MDVMMMLHRTIVRLVGVFLLFQMCLWSVIPTKLAEFQLVQKKGMMMGHSSALMNNNDS